MTDSQDRRLERTLDHLDAIFDSAYFTPLALGDALAVQFRVPALTGLPLETVTAVFHLMDHLDITPGSDGEPEMAETAGRFFNQLKKEFPDVWDRWAAADPGVVVDPVTALNAVTARADDTIADWLSGRADEFDPALLEDLTAKGIEAAMAAFSPDRFPDDHALRRYLRDELLPEYPAWTVPTIYLETWIEYARAVMDLSPRPQTKARWPY